MNHLERDTYGMYKGVKAVDLGLRLMGANTMIGDDVYNKTDDKLGDIKEFMVNTEDGTITYAVLSFGGFLGMGDKLFAVPWKALTLNHENKRFVMNITKEKLKDAPGFDKDNWPDFADPSLTSSLDSYYGVH